MIEHHSSELRKLGLSDIFDDDWTRTIYSVDASHCAIKPLAVNFPSDEKKKKKICIYANKHHIPITSRGAGTGLVGQSLSDGIILDFTKKMNKVLEIGDDYVVVQPGVVKTILDMELAKRGKFIPPDPASSNYCTIGGMVSNNSSGPHGLGYGSIINYVQDVKLVYSNGMMGFAAQKVYDETVRKMLKFILSVGADIKKYYPHVSKNSSGYRLDAVFENNNVNPQRLFVASEGSLGIITSTRISILDMPEKKSLVILKFKDILDAVSAVPSILEHRPVAMELLDRGTILEGWKHGDSNDSNSCMMFVEFHSSDNSIYGQVHQFENDLQRKATILETGHDQNSIKRAWDERKNSLNRAIKRGTDSRKPAGIIEDTVVHPDMLYDYTIFLLKLLNTYNLEYVVYGHAGNGNLHLRPMIGINSKESDSLMSMVANKVFNYVRNVHGSMSGEHGDGLLRTKYIPMMYGSQMYDVFKQIKLIFDEKKIMNPGKKVL